MSCVSVFKVKVHFRLWSKCCRSLSRTPVAIVKGSAGISYITQVLFNWITECSGNDSCPLIFYYSSSPRENDAARQIDYMSHLDFMAGEVIFTQMSLNSFDYALNWNLTAGRGSAEPLVATADWSRTVDQGLLRPLHPLPVPTLRAGAVGRRSRGHPHPVGSCGTAFQNQSGATAGGRVVAPFILQTAPDWRKPVGCWCSFEKRHCSSEPAGCSSGSWQMQILPKWCFCQFSKITWRIWMRWDVRTLRFRYVAPRYNFF